MEDFIFIVHYALFHTFRHVATLDLKSLITLGVQPGQHGGLYFCSSLLSRSCALFHTFRHVATLDLKSLITPGVRPGRHGGLWS